MKVFNITAIGEILYDVYPDRKRLGGAPFNFIYHVWKILGKANFISKVGNDENGKEILQYLSSMNFNTDYITIDNEHPTGTVNVRLDENKIPHFTISPKCSYDYITLNEKTIKLIDEHTDILYFGTLSQRSEISRKTINSLFGKNIKYFCDLNLRHNFFSKDMIEKALNVSNIIKINYDEFKKIIELFDLNIKDELAIKQLSENYKIELLCITFGAEGALLYKQNEFSKYKADVKDIIDTVGAGDAYSAILCIGYLYGFNLSDINKLANEFAVDICMFEGAIPSDDSIYEKYRKIFLQSYL